MTQGSGQPDGFMVIWELVRKPPIMIYSTGAMQMAMSAVAIR
jgi:hypothetical protein